MLDCILTEIPLVGWHVKTTVILFVDGSCGAFSEGLSEQVLCLQAWYESLISWNELLFEVLGGSSNPVVTLH